VRTLTEPCISETINMLDIHLVNYTDYLRAMQESNA
jgi:hypothetical protein